MDGVSAISLILIASFTIERIVSGLLFALGFLDAWSRKFPDPAAIADPIARTAAEKKTKLVSFAFACVLGIGVIGWYGQVRVLKAMLGTGVSPVLDIIVTGLALVAGADRIGAILKMPGAPGVERKPPEPIEIRGTLVLDDSGSKRVTGAGMG